MASLSSETTRKYLVYLCALSLPGAFFGCGYSIHFRANDVEVDAEAEKNQDVENSDEKEDDVAIPEELVDSFSKDLSKAIAYIDSYVNNPLV